jgi:hypothetical protein
VSSTLSPLSGLLLIITKLEKTNYKRLTNIQQPIAPILQAFLRATCIAFRKHHVAESPSLGGGRLNISCLEYGGGGYFGTEFVLRRMLGVGLAMLLRMNLLPSQFLQRSRSEKINPAPLQY